MVDWYGQFGIVVNSKSEENRNQIKDLIRNKIEPQLRQQFLNLIPTLFAVHLESIQHTAPAEKTAAPSDEKAAPSDKVAEVPVEEAAAPPKNGTIVNSTTLTDQEEFRTTALELFKTFTEEDRLSAFTRARPKRFDGAKVGGQFELFDGNVAGEYLELNEPTKIVQSWRLKQWPAGHYSRQTIEFVQNDDDGVTVMRVTWTGVPLGQEEVTKGNWGEYYVRSIKRTFGYVMPYSIMVVEPYANFDTDLEPFYNGQLHTSIGRIYGRSKAHLQGSESLSPRRWVRYRYRDKRHSQAVPEFDLGDV